MRYLDKKVLLLGYGKSGKSVESFLKKEGAIVDIFDDAISGGMEESFGCKRYDFCVISPGVSLEHRLAGVMIGSGVPVLSEPDLAYLNCPSDHIFAVSGTNGKTTTCRIAAEMMRPIGRTHLVGNIGVPFIAEIEKIGKRDHVVVEMSSFQIEQSSHFLPEYAALTNVGEDHLDRHHSADRYREIKLSLLRKARHSIVNLDDPFQAGIKGFTYSMKDPAANYCLIGRELRWAGDSVMLPEISRGGGFDRDYLCAFALCVSAFGYRKTFVKCYDTVSIPHYRNEYIGRLGGAKVFNDSKGTNIDATIFALSERKEGTAIILGGSDKGESYARLMQAVGKGAERIYLVGANAMDMFLAADEAVKRKCLPMPDLESCVKDFAARPLEALLFSPASASFDQFKNYEERGMAFNEIIRKYISK